MIHDIFLRWIVTALLALYAGECLFVIATRRRMWIHVVGYLLHFIMSLAMVVMAWPWGATLPAAPPMVFFLLAALWFLAVGFAGVGHRVVSGYHALMMLAMAWMYAVMNGALFASPAWIGAINWSCTIGFAIAGYLMLYRYFAVRKAKPTRPSRYCLGIMRHTMMAAGMAIMFGVML
jgi:hypothetical protein